jgi:cell division septum initiation protein DivIVA
MHSGNAPTTLRRSSRVPTAVPILVTSLEGKHFSDVCETEVVNAHGCAILTRVKLESGVPLHFHNKDGRETTARVVSCQPIGSDQRNWRLGAKLDRPENFWGLRDCPEDWALPATVVPPKLPQTASTTTPASHQAPGQLNQPSETVFDRVARQLDAQVKRTITESLRPLQAEIVALKERLARREANPSRFEVSLSSIPPEVEQKIESRLRTNLGPRVLDEARQQSAHLLASAKAMIDQRTNEAHETFLRGVANELRVVDQRAQEMSISISENTQEHLRRGLEQFQRELLDGGNSLKRLSEELLEFLQYKLTADHDARRGDLEQLRAAVASESARLQQQVEDLDARIAKLDESARGLESGLDQRLSRISSDTVRETRSQFESAASEILEELAARSVRVLGNQLEETSGNMKVIQEGIAASVSESLKGQAANALQAFEQSMDRLARLSVESWRLKLEGGLNAVTKSLNEQFRSGAGEDGK